MKNATSFIKTAWNATVSFVNTYKAEIAGFVVGLAVGIGCTVATGGVGVVACAIAGGAAGAAVTNVIQQAESGKPFDVGSFLFDTAVGGAKGAVGGAAGPLLGAAIRSITTSGAGAAAISAVRTGMQNVFNRMPSFRPSPAPVRPAAAPGGGARPAGNVASRADDGASCVANSFAPGTQVLMADGTASPIEQIELGELVWAADPETGEAGARPVTALIEGTGSKDLVTVTTDSGSVVATAGHPFWSVSEASWVDAGDLAVGDAVLEVDGSESVVTATSEVTVQATVHNLTVADIHTYFVFVGDAPTLVHNSSCPLALPAAGREPPWAGDSMSRVTASDETFYRVSGGDVGPIGAWLTPIRPLSSAAARDGLALPPGNAATSVAVVRVPAGTRVQVGAAGPAFGRPGGWPQAQLLEAIADSAFGPGKLLQ